MGTKRFVRHTANGRSTIEGTQYDMSSSATFIVKLVRFHGDWKIISLECIYDKDNLVPVVNTPKTPLVIDYPRESYKCLGYILGKAGYTVDPNLPGWDRPSEAQTHLESARHWTQIT
jgi:hypothetical protein